MAEVIPERVEIAIAGGSIGGLCAGNVLAASGRDVHIFERSASRLTSSGAGIVVQPDLLTLLDSIDAPELAVTTCSTRKTYYGSSSRARTMSLPQQFTSWEAIYSALMAAFPPDRYHTNAALEIAHASSDGVTATVLEQTVQADLLIAADGSRSAIRAAFAPETVSRYAGYIAWRGVVEEADLPEALVAFFDDSFSFCELVEGGHALCYFIPGEGGNEAAGRRRLNWVWYVTVAEGQSLDALMTDSNGRRRETSVPAGLVSAAAVEEFRERASLLEPHFAELLRATQKPFIQSIMDVIPPQMVFSRVCLLGDAAFVVRPHTAAGTAKAAAEASALASALRHFAPDTDLALAKWNHTQTAAGRRLTDYGVRLGERSRS